MTKTEVQQILDVLQRITTPDGRVVRAIAICERQMKVYEASKGQLRDEYDYLTDYFKWGGR